MNTEPTRRRTRVLGLSLAGGALLASVLGILSPGGCSRNPNGTDEASPPPVAVPLPSNDLAQRTKVFCSSCHSDPPPETFPRSAWKDEIERMYEFYARSGRPLQPPYIDHVIKYYEDRAPLQLPPADIRPASSPLPIRLLRIDYPVFAGPPVVTPPHISNVNLVRLFDRKRPDVLCCEMKGGAVLALQPYLAQPTWRALYAPGGDKDFHPAHAEVVDLDKDGIPDILIANLGSFLPTDRRCGQVLWMRGLGKGRFDKPVVLLKDKGRIADVQAADINGDGKLDLIVACFGWNTIGEICYLENQTTDWNKPRFTVRVLDERHGAIHVPITDLNGDGKPDFIALLSQENEAIVAFLNKGGGDFDKQTLYQASHPGYGSSGIQLADLNGDGQIDILYTNGDVLDQPYLLKPYHSVQWLENKGGLKFEHHPLTPMYGVHRAVAADLDGDGDLDIVATSFLPADEFKERTARKLAAVVVLEQTAPGTFAYHALEAGNCDYVSCAVGDVFGTGRQDIVTGAFTGQPLTHAVTVWRNQGATGGVSSRKRD